MSHTKEQARAYYLKNRERILAKMKTAEYKERRKKWRNKYRKEHPDKVKAEQKRFYEKHKGDLREYNRARKRAIGSRGWLVLQAETCEEDGGLWIAATPFSRLEDAKARLKAVISEEWGPMRLEYPDGITRDVRLGEHPGYKYPSTGTIKHSLVYFAEDGMEAWDMLGDIEKKITVVRTGKEGERIC